jgi:hypothetical protein
MATSHQLDSSLEALTNLLYLLRMSLNDPVKAAGHLDVAEKVLADIVESRRLHPVHSPRD